MESSEADVVNLVLHHFKEIDEVNAIINRVVLSAESSIALESDLERFTVIVDTYQEQPHLIDPYLDGLVSLLLGIVRDPAVSKLAFHQAFRYLYLLTKVRGYKQILRCFSHEVADFEPVFSLLVEQRPCEHETWETRYILLLWLSIICIIPFDLSKLDGTGSGKGGAVNRVLDIAKLYLNATDKSKDAAAFLLAKFLTRPDVKVQHLPAFVEWSVEVLNKKDGTTMDGMNLLIGVLGTLGLIFQHGKRDDLLQHAHVVLEHVRRCDLLEIKNTLLRKLVIKLIQRLGLTFLKPKVASWRYNRGNRSLEQNLMKSAKEVSKDGLGGDTQGNSVRVEEEEDFDIPEDVESVIELLLNGLKDKDTVVRWSAAKGVGRMSGRLPRELADEVVGSLLGLFTFAESDGAWHGGCLALAELGRRGLLLPTRLGEVVPIILKALAYDERRGSASVGAHVRDAACYVCWSFSRAYDPEQMKPYVRKIASALIITAVFDREINCRRAASAAFQENVGRQGAFPHGIDILTAADYFAVGNRSHCYCNLSVYIASFEEYTHAMINHLVDVKSSHWDSDIRDLTALALHEMTVRDPEYIVEKVIPTLLSSSASIDLNTRHGSIVALAEVIHALYKIRCIESDSSTIVLLIGDSNVKAIGAIAGQMIKSKQLRGFGGELMRKALCRLIEKLSLSKMEFQDPNVLRDWQEVIDDCLPHTEPDVQACAASALTPFLVQYCSDEKSKSSRGDLVKKYCSKLSSSLCFDRMGFAQGLGALPAFLLLEHTNEIVRSLVRCCHLDTDRSIAGMFAESRRDSLLALCRICRTLGVREDSALCASTLTCLYECFFQSMGDYTVDNRGDVGAWVREAAMSGLECLTLGLASDQPSFLSTDICFSVVCHLVQQASEKIDRTRACAGSILKKLLYSATPSILPIPDKEKLLECLPMSLIGSVNWAAPSEAFPLVTRLLALDRYRYHALLGLTVSAGGLTESLVRHASGALLDFLQSIQDDADKMDEIVSSLLRIFDLHKKNDRVIVPLLKVLDLLFTSGCFCVYQDADNDKNMFMTSLLKLAKSEIKGCPDAKKLLASINVFAGLVAFKNVRQASLQQLMIFLCHKFPRVRKATAEQLYTVFISYDDIVDDAERLEQVVALLSDVSWDDAVEGLRSERNKLCLLIGVPAPVLTHAAAKSISGTKQQKVDELDSYKDLVSRHGF